MEYVTIAKAEIEHGKALCDRYCASQKTDRRHGGCCPCAASGHAAAPVSAVMNSRRLIFACSKSSPSRQPCADAPGNSGEMHRIGMHGIANAVTKKRALEAEMALGASCVSPKPQLKRE